MYNNAALKTAAENLVARVALILGYSGDEDRDRVNNAAKRRISFVAELTTSTEKTPLLGML